MQGPFGTQAQAARARAKAMGVPLKDLKVRAPRPVKEQVQVSKYKYVSYHRARQAQGKAAWVAQVPVLGGKPKAPAFQFPGPRVARARWREAR